MHSTFRYLNKYRSHQSSHVVPIKGRYSVSLNDLETINYFLVQNEMRYLPRKKHLPKIDLLVSKHPTQLVYLSKSTGVRDILMRIEDTQKP